MARGGEGGIEVRDGGKRAKRFGVRREKEAMRVIKKGKRKRFDDREEGRGGRKETKRKEGKNVM